MIKAETYWKCIKLTYETVLPFLQAEGVQHEKNFAGYIEERLKGGKKATLFPEGVNSRENYWKSPCN
jgi:hypothetical protein